MPTRDQWLAALRRFAVIVVAAAGVTIAISLAVGAIAGASVARSISLGLDVVGSFTLLIGFFAGNRGPVRMRGDAAAAIFGQKLVRWATPSEREETLNLSAVLVTVGFVLVLLGLAADPRYSLF